MSAAAEFVKTLFSSSRYKLIGEGDLSYSNPPKGKVFAGCFPGMGIVASLDFVKDLESVPLLHFARAKPWWRIW